MFLKDGLKNRFILSLILLQNKRDSPVQYMHASNCTNPFSILSKNIYFNKNIFKIYIMCFNQRVRDMMQGCWLHDSRLLNLLEQCMCLYCDPAYPMSLRIHLQTPFIDARLTTVMDSYRYNKSMSRVRMSVEWTFGEIL